MTAAELKALKGSLDKIRSDANKMLRSLSEKGLASLENNYVSHAIEIEYEARKTLDNLKGMEA